MLVDYKFNNYASFYNETELSFKANSNSQFKENTFKTPYGRLNKSGLIFGANGSGKSNLLNSLEYMCKCVVSSLELQSKLISSPNYFIFNEGSSSKAKSFEATFIVDDVLYKYGFSLLDSKVDKEYLYKKIKRETMIFNRSNPSYKSIKVTSDFDNVKHLAQNTREDSLFLSWASNGNNELAMKIRNWFNQIEIFDGDDTSEFLSSTVEFIQEDSENKEKVLNFLNDADIDVLDFKLKVKEDDARKLLIESLNKSALEKLDSLPSMRTVDLKLIHKYYSDDWNDEGIVETNIGFESNGTRKMFEIAGPIIDAVENGKIIIIDEIDARLHPLLVNHLINKFNENSTNAQLICTTHNVLLLDEKVRKDQIFCVNKDEYGVSSLKCIGDIKGIRRNSKLIKQYLSGELTGIPKLKTV